jgi:hypothetical protein
MGMRSWKTIIGWDSLWKRIFRIPPDYTKVRFATSFRAAKSVGKKEIVFIGDKSSPKWAVIKCPCGCGDLIHIDLMGSHTPSWTCQFEKDKTVSFSPSLWVDSSKCGSHFWIRNNRVLWHSD